MSLELTGVLKVKGETQTFGSNGFQKREFVIIDNSNEQHPQPIQMELVKDKCSMLDNYNEGQEIKVSINILGREWINPEGQSRYFNSMQAWRIEEYTNKSPASGYVPLPSDLDSDLGF